MEFVKFRELLQAQIKEMFKQKYLFVTDRDSYSSWNVYLNSFPEEYNPVFRERRVHDCNACMKFIRDFSNVVSIIDNKLVSIWDFKINDPEFTPVVKAMSKYIKAAPIKDVFLSLETNIGISHNFEEAQPVIRWEHLFINLPSKFVHNNTNTFSSVIATYRDTRHVFHRSLKELTLDSIDITLDLIRQNSLYRGEEQQSKLELFRDCKIEYDKLKPEQQELYCWINSLELGQGIGRIRNHAIGTFLIDLSNDVDLEIAVKKYYKVMDPTNYHRPKEVFTGKMIEQAQQTITELGYLDSLGRRYATIDDITINNVLHANRDVKQRITTGDVFSEMKSEATSVNIKSFDRVEEVPIEKFISEILPNVIKIDLLFESRLEPNLVSLIAPKMRDAKSMFKWNNPFSWAYNGNITDSMMKENVKAAGGKVDGPLRFSIQWNEKGDNQNDYDAHCMEQFPGGSHIYYHKKGIRQSSSGMLDVDIIQPDQNQVAVENIIYTNLKKMPYGKYLFRVHLFSERGGRNGFRAELEFDGQIYSFDYQTPMKYKEYVDVALVEHTEVDGFKLVKSLNSNHASKEIWGVKTNQFIPVSTLMFSPNYWDGQNGIGNKHYFFMLQGCINDTTPNGFFNEFLKADLLDHKRVLAALGSKMKVDPDERQLSGVGFSSTQKKSVICKLEGTFNRTIKLVF